LLATATAINRLADTSSPPHPLVSSEPFGYYPEDSWRDDMTLGGAEIALAKLDLHSTATSYLKQAATWAAAYRRHEASSETFNLYDTSALADADLATAITRSHTHARLAVGRAGLVAELKRQIHGGLRRSRHDPFGNGGFIDEFDIDSHTFGLIATVAMYDAVTHRHDFQQLATRQRNWLFGANPWGASFMVGEGSNFPACMQHQVANLSGSLNGSAPLDVGAVVNGPNDKRLFNGGLGSLQEHVRRCPANRSDRYAPFSGRGSRYIDDERSWQTNEPAIDFTGTAILAAALQESQAR
jgi:endoglucanase